MSKVYIGVPLRSFKISKKSDFFVKTLINLLDIFLGMNFEDVALRLGVSKEMLILIAVEAAIVAAAALVGVPAEKIGKVPL